jgi:predicted phosphate transport protein (TIGR00153 family)
MALRHKAGGRIPPAARSRPVKEGDRVKLSLVPQEREYFRLFSEFAATLNQAAQLLASLMNDFGSLKSTARQMVELEHVGDKIVHDIVRRLNKTFITPLDREDIYDLAATLDEVLDSIEAAVDMMLLYRIEAPAQHAVEQSAVIAKQTAVLRTAIDSLEKRKGLNDHWIEVNRLENDGDRLYRDAVAELFDGDMKCTDIIKWKDIYSTLEHAIDDCEHVANIIESIVLKNT